MPYLTLDIWYQYLPCYIWYVIPDTGTCHVILATWYRTLILAMLYLTNDIWPRYLPCYTWPWYMTPVLVMLYLTLIYDTGTCHAILDTWYITLVLVMLYLTYDTWHRYLTCYICHMIYNTWHLYYLTYSWLLCDQTSGTPVSPVLLYSCISWTPVLLNSCTPEPLKKGDSWYYTPVNSRSWIIMVILYTLVDIIFGQYI